MKCDLDISYLRTCLIREVYPKCVRWKHFEKLKRKEKIREQRRILTAKLKERIRDQKRITVLAKESKLSLKNSCILLKFHAIIYSI